MTSYIFRRFILFIPTLMLVVTAVFFLIRLLPGDTVTLMAEQNRYGPSGEAMRKELGLDKPIHEQYLVWLGELARGDLGESLNTGRSATQELRERGPVSLQLGAMSIFVSVIIAVPLGVISGMKARSVTDYTSRMFAILMLAIPNFWFATMVIVIPSVLWNYRVVPDYVPFFEDPFTNLRVVMIPALIGGAAASAGILRLTRTMVLEIQRQDYIRTARAKGLSSPVVAIRHTLKNALIPVVTVIGLQIPVVISGSVVMEQVFSIPGMGRFLLNNIASRDYPMVQATTLVFALVVMLVNLAVDISYPLLDPRVKVSR